MPRGRTWSSKELEIVRTEYRRGGYQAVQRRLPDRSKLAIISTAQRQGISRNGDTGKAALARPWSTGENTVLRRSLPEFGVEGVQRLLPHRTNAEIEAQAKVLGVDHQGRRA